MRRLALLISIVAWTAGCGDQPPPLAAAPTPEAPRTAELSCGSSGFGFADRPPYRDAARHPHTVQAGPLTLLWLKGWADEPPSWFRARADGGRRVLHTKVLLAPRRTVTIGVAPEHRERVALSGQHFNQDIAYAQGDAAITLEGCPPRSGGPLRGTGYAFTVLVDGPGCGTFEITPEGEPTMRRTVGFGVSGCG